MSCRKVLSALALTLSIVGCGSEPRLDGRLEVKPVTGSVYYQGKPAVGARVTLHAINSTQSFAGLNPNATADADGNLAFTSYVARDGVPVGEYQITVVWPDAAYVPRNAMEKEAIEMGGEQPDKLKGRYSNPGQFSVTATVTDQPNQELPRIELK